MKNYRRHEDGAVTNPANELQLAAVAGTVAAVTVVSKAASDIYDLIYDLGKAGLKKASDCVCGWFKKEEKDEKKAEKKAA